jgi:hypothetical protein
MIEHFTLRSSHVWENIQGNVTPENKVGVTANMERLVAAIMRENYGIRKVQAYSGERSLTFVLPKMYSKKLGIEKGDFLKVHIDDMVVQKADV